MEKWIIINNTKEIYSVSSLGRIRNNITNEILKGSHTGKTEKRKRKPYNCHGLIINGKREFELTHRIVARHFIPNPNDYLQINHINKNVNDNRVENLEWCNNQQNSRHNHKKNIIQSDLDGNIIKIWDGLFHIKDELKINISTICSYCKHKINKSYRGYFWRYENSQ